jgi:peroxiredoxin
MKPIVNNLSKRFPTHNGIKSFIALYNAFWDKKTTQPTNHKPGVGDEAPDFKMMDENGMTFSLKELRGKYVLVDFWASWCGPCRGENPNVVVAYNKFKNKNFTVLGVSLDEKREAWVNAIKEDNLTWKHVSDLKGWESEIVPLYGFDGIPYNVLIDPNGKILATELREEALLETLENTFSNK